MAVSAKYAKKLFKNVFQKVRPYRIFCNNPVKIDNTKAINTI